MCALGLVGVGLPSWAVAQDAASPKTSSQKTAGAAAAKPSSQASSHPASHPSANQHSKPNTATASPKVQTRQASKKASGKKKTGSKRTTAHGQQKIEPERAQAIQEALIREHYLNGEATGTWNQASEDAMRKYQADHGWQSKTVPDARALISLGLGPSHDHLLNPESAMTTGPDTSHPASANSVTPVSHNADPGTRLDTNPTTPNQAASDHDSTGPQ